MTSPIRWGLIGFGLFGQHYARALAANPQAELVAITAASEVSRHAAAQAYPQAHICPDVDTLLRQTAVEAVALVAPNHLHHPLGLAVLRAGKHLLLEKPMAQTLAECDELLAAAGPQQVFAINHELRLSSLWGGVKDLIDQGVIGAPRYALINLLRFPYRPGSGSWRYDPHRVGNWILEEPIHFFDLARWYLQSLGEAASIYARGNGASGESPDLLPNLTATLNFPGGGFAVIAQTLSAFGHHQIGQVAGDDGAIWASWSAADARDARPSYFLRYGRGQQVTEVSLDKPAGELLELADQLAAVGRCIREGAPPPCTAHDGRWSTRLCLAAAESIRQGQPVMLG